MAALQSIRGKAGLLVTVLGIALLAFILGDVFSSGSTLFSKHKDNAFSVDGDVVPTRKYSDRIEDWETFEKLISNQSSLDESASSNIRDMVYQQMVKEMMLDDQAEALGLAVTSDELYEMVYGANVSPLLHRIPLFMDPQTRQFEREYLDQFLQSVNQDVSSYPEEYQHELLMAKNVWLTIENLLKYQRLEEKYVSLVSGTVLVNELEIQSFKDDSKTEANIAYVINKYNEISDSTITVSDNEIKDLYNKYKSNFKLDIELRKISYFIKDVIPSDEDYATVEKEMEEGAQELRTSTNPALVVNHFSGNKYVDAYMAINSLPLDAKNFVERATIGDLYGPMRDNESFVMYKLLDKTVGPDSVQLQMIALPQEFDMKTVELITDSLLNVINKGKSFADVANEYMPESDGGKLPMMDEMSLVSAGISRECIDSPKGTVMKIKLMGQNRLVRIAEKSKPVSKVKLAAVQMPVIISDRTHTIIDNELSQFINESGNLDNFNAAATNQGYALMQDALVRPDAQNLLGNIGTRHVIHWAYGEKIGVVKKFDVQDKRIVAMVTEIIKEDYMPISELTQSLKQELIRDKKAEKMIADMKSKGLTTLSAYAEDMNTRVDTAKFVSFQTEQISGVGIEPIFNVYAKNAQVGKIQEPLKGVSGIYVLGVVAKNEKPSIMSDEQVKENLQQKYFYQIYPGVMMALNGKMNVKDNRVNFW